MMETFHHFHRPIPTFQHPLPYMNFVYRLAPPPPPPPPHLQIPATAMARTYYDYLVVVDFEATCDDGRNNTEEPRPLRSDRQEIIQFPAVLVDVAQLRIVDYFDSYVRPVEKPLLSEFCTSLTGITQSMVDGASRFPKILRKFDKWLKKNGLSNSASNGKTFAIVTDGSYDIGHFLYKQTLISNIPFPAYARRWVNLRTIFTKFYGARWYNLKSVLEQLNLPFEGRQHNGLDDSRNIAKVLLVLLGQGGIVSHNEQIVLDYEEQARNEIRILSDKNARRYDLATVEPMQGTECIYLIPPHGIITMPSLLYVHPEPLPPLQQLELNNENNKENCPAAPKPEKKSKGSSSSSQEKRHSSRKGGRSKSKTANKDKGEGMPMANNMGPNPLEQITVEVQSI